MYCVRAIWASSLGALSRLLTWRGESPAADSLPCRATTDSRAALPRRSFRAVRAARRRRHGAVAAALALALAPVGVAKRTSLTCAGRCPARWEGSGPEGDRWETAKRTENVYRRGGRVQFGPAPLLSPRQGVTFLTVSWETMALAGVKKNVPHPSAGLVLTAVCWQKKSGENINSRLALVMKSGKYNLGFKSTLKTLRQGKGSRDGARACAHRRCSQACPHFWELPAAAPLRDRVLCDARPRRRPPLHWQYALPRAARR